MLYDTQAKRERFVKKKGTIITFKKPFFPNGEASESRRQILNEGLKKVKSGNVKIVGPFYDSKWYDSIDNLIEAIDWEWMEDAHS